MCLGGMLHLAVLQHELKCRGFVRPKRLLWRFSHLVPNSALLLMPVYHCILNSQTVFVITLSLFIKTVFFLVVLTLPARNRLLCLLLFLRIMIYIKKKKPVQVFVFCFFLCFCTFEIFRLSGVSDVYIRVGFNKHAFN